MPFSNQYIKTHVNKHVKQAHRKQNAQIQKIGFCQKTDVNAQGNFLTLKSSQISFHFSSYLLCHAKNIS